MQMAENVYLGLINPTVPSNRNPIVAQDIIDVSLAEVADPNNGYVRETFLKFQEVTGYDPACAGLEAQYLADLD